MLLTKLSLGGNNDVIYKLFPPRESLVSDIPAGDGNIEKLFYGVSLSNANLLAHAIIIKLTSNERKRLERW
jgi:hypothetical protein